jgi:DNA-binding response OmpR family regulator
MTQAQQQGASNGLIISDDRDAALRILPLLKRFVRRTTAVVLADAVRTIAFQTVNIIVLDAKERSNEFLAVIERFAASGKQIRVLAIVPARLLAHVRMPKRLSGDFVVEGASDAEIMARLRFLTVASERDEDEEIIRDGEFSLDPAQHKVYCGDEALVLAHIEFALLSFFITHPNRAYSREELLRRVWGSQDGQPSRTVDVHVRRIRAKLNGQQAARLETVRGIGYLWRARQV